MDVHGPPRRGWEFEVVAAVGVSVLLLGALAASVWILPETLGQDRGGSAASAREVFGSSSAGWSGTPTAQPGGPAVPGEEEDHDHVGEVYEPHPSIVGKVAYTGPDTPEAIMAACAKPSQEESLACDTTILERLLAGRGSEAAFTLLEDMGRIDAFINQRSHHAAHALGAAALAAYGSIEETFRTCSYKVFGGCFHGSLQAYFAGLPQVNASVVRELPCPTDSAFHSYTCFHGVGHGLMLASANALNWSLDLCDKLPSTWSASSCHGGVFMENVVGYIENRTGQDTHAHGPPRQWYVPDADPQYPCNAVAAQYRSPCWLIHTSLVLFLKGGDFRALAGVCENVEAPWNVTCAQSMGRDAADYTNRNPASVSETCSLLPAQDERAACIRGFAADVVLNYVSPEEGFRACQAVSLEKAACYGEAARQGATMRDGGEMARLCATVEEGYQSACRTGAGL